MGWLSGFDEAGRPYEPGTDWAIYASHLWDYMHRFIVRYAQRSTRLHHILRSDADDDFHDHPFDFVSVLLTAGYLEHLPGSADQPFPSRTVYHPRFSVVRHKAGAFHRLELVDGPVWTLCFTSKRLKSWGFLTPRGFVPWREYVSRKP